MSKTFCSLQHSHSIPQVEAVEHRLLFASGHLDTSFSGNGLLDKLPGISQGQITATLAQSDGKILTAGYAFTGYPQQTTNNYIFVTRLNKDGTPDKSFNGTGTLLISEGKDESTPDMALQSDGKIVLATDGMLARVNTNGKLDTSFGGGDGIATYSGGVANSAVTLALRPDDKIIVGILDNATVRRFFSDGSFDKLFGTNGVESLDSSVSSSFRLTKVLRQSDGSLMAVGSEGSSNPEVALVKLQASGLLDKSWGTKGIITTKIGSYSGPSAAVLQSDGKLLVTGDVGTSSTTQEEFVARYNTNGSLDKTFNSTGIREFVYVSSNDQTSPEGASSITVKSDGKIVIGGDAWKGKPVFALIQLKSNGADDTSFGSNARAFGGLSTYTNIDNSIAITPTQQTVLGGYDNPVDSPEIAVFTN